MRKRGKILLLFLGLLLTYDFPLSNLITASIAAEVTIEWNANSEPDLDGYSVYASIGTSGPPYELIDDISLDEFNDPANPESIVSELEDGQKYYFVVTAYDKAGNESGFSDEICVKIDNNSIIDCTKQNSSDIDSKGESGSVCFISISSGWIEPVK